MISLPHIERFPLSSFALNQIKNTKWAMSEDALRTLIQLAGRNSDFEGLEKLRGEKARTADRAIIRGGVGIIPVRGPLFKRANLMTEHCGATSYELVLRDFHQLLSSPSVKSIVFDIDSPGGEVNGCSELADHIHAARGQKPLTAYIGGTGASAAYWIASACDRILVSDSAIVGSIGVQSVLESGKSEGELRFVSSQSPNKNRDPGTEEGAKEVQAVIDGLAEVFLQKVARNRGISTADVLEKFGKGSVFVGIEAQKRGLVDEISTLENVITKPGENKMTVESITAAMIAEKHPEIARHFMEIGMQRGAEDNRKAVEAERRRISAIRALCEGDVSWEFCQALIDEGVSEEASALRILGELKKSPRKTASEKKDDSRAAFDRNFAALDIPPKGDPTDVERLLASSLELAKKSGIRVRDN